MISFNTSREIPPYVSVDLCLWTSQYCVILGFHSHLGIRDSVVGIATHYGLDGPGIEYRWGAMFSAPVQTGSEAHPASYTWCGRKVMRLARLCTNRQRCCLPLHMAVRLTPAVDSVQVWTCYSCYAIVESVWSEVVFVKCVTKMDRQKFEQRSAIKFCVKLGESATVTYEKLQRAYKPFVTFHKSQAGWASEPVWTGAENIAPHQHSIPGPSSP